jgi:hypothetical protein
LWGRGEDMGKPIAGFLGDVPFVVEFEEKIDPTLIE